MLKISICDDDLTDCKNIKKYISEYFNNIFIDCSIDLFSNGTSFLSTYKKGDYNIIFLDVYLDDMLGVDIAKEIRKIDSDVAIIFSTCSIYHCLDGFEVNATHYLVKPINYNKVESALDRCNHLLNESKNYIVVLSNKSEFKVFEKDIIFIEVHNTMSSIHTVKGTIYTYMSLKKLENIIKSNSFLRCHKSYLVNMNYIKDIKSNSFILVNDIIVPIKQNGGKVIKNIYLDYIFK